MNRGYILPSAIIVLTVALVAIFVLLIGTTNESKWSLKSKQSAVGLSFAKTGISRAIWKLNESDAVFTYARSGTVITGYNFDAEYNDFSDGSYKIKFSPGPSANQVTIISSGKDSSLGTVQTIEVIVERSIIKNAWLACGEIKFKKGVLAHWGPISAYGGRIISTSDPLPYYPRKYASGLIPERDNDPAEPNTDNIEYWVKYELGDPPVIDLDYYKNNAKNSTVPAPIEKGKPMWTADPPGSGYILTHGKNLNIKLKNPYEFISDTSTLYFAGGGTVNIKDDFYVEASMIFEGNVHVHNVGRTVSHTVPAGASLEYVHENAVDFWESTGWVEGEETNIDLVIQKGFFYVGQDWKCSGGNNAIIGVGYINGDMELATITLYYDPQYAANIHCKYKPLEKISWKQITPAIW